MANENLISVIAKIKKLLALAGNNPSVEESAAASARAQALMQEYHLSMAAVDAAALDSQDPMGRTGFQEEHKPRKMDQWKRAFISRIARLHDCRAYSMAGSPLMQIIGRESDRQIVAYLATFIVREIEQLAYWDYKWNASQGGSDAGRDTWITNFGIGATDTIIARMNGEKQKFTATPAGNALVLRRDVDLSKYMAQQGIVLSKGRPSGYRGNADARANGAAAAANITWRPGVNGPGCRHAQIGAAR